MTLNVLEREMQTTKLNVIKTCAKFCKYVQLINKCYKTAVHI